MSKCNKSKNPCKICLTPVTHKTGLQCQGACQSWVHYACLNYTPGKIKDIKAGIIKVTCPCPDCKTSGPKEFRTDEPYSCNNSQCPANLPPRCDNTECPTNPCGKDPKTPPPCPLHKCGTKCKQYSSPHLPDNKKNDFQYMPKPCVAESSSDAFKNKETKCPSSCSSGNNVSGDGGKYQNFAVIEEMCNTVGELSNQLKELMCQMQQASQSPGGQRKVGPKPCFCPGNPARRM